MQFLRNTSTDPYFNMAFDQYCLEQSGLDAPVFYLWQNSPSVIVGLSQCVYSEVDLNYLEQQGIKLVRRVTGGGAVYHDLQNLNYTIVGRSSDLEKDYPGYVNMMVAALRELGLDAEANGRNDILIDGRKCSGYAKRVYKDRLMIHGTLMYDVDIETLTKVLATAESKLSAKGIASVRSRVANIREFLPGIKGIQEFKEALEEVLSRNADGDHDSEVKLSTDALEIIDHEADSKFRTWEWNYGLSPAADFKKACKYPSCGTVELSFSIEHGCLASVRFGGDYIGNRSAQGLESKLGGCSYDIECIRQILETAEKENKTVSQSFDGLVANDLVNLFRI